MADRLDTEGTVAWFFSRDAAAKRGKPKTTKAITRKLHLDCEQLEKRVLFSGNVWLPQQVQPLDGVTGYNQSFQAYHAALGDPMVRSLESMLGALRPTACQFFVSDWLSKT
jgi:hypothetical protein